MESAAGHLVHVWIVDIIALDVLQNLAIDSQCTEGFVVGRTAHHVARGHVQKHHSRKHDYDFPGERTHSGFLLPAQSAEGSAPRNIAHLNWMRPVSLGKPIIALGLSAQLLVRERLTATGDGG